METVCTTSFEQGSKSKKLPGVFGGAMIIAGSAIGAGMFSLPIVSAGMWFPWGIGLLILAWFCMYSSSLMILETNLHFHNGSSFDTLTKETLGDWARVLNGLSVAFVLYIVSYAYVSGGSSMLNHIFKQSLGLDLAPGMCGLLFGLTMAAVVTISTSAVDRFISMMLILMVGTFFSATLSIGGSIQLTTILPEQGVSYLPFVFITLPFMLSSFGYHGNVPSLVKYYGGNASKVRNALLIGSFIGLACYSIWMFVSMGVLGREGLRSVIAAGGNMGDLVGAIETVINATSVGMILNAFAMLAVATSFLAGGLALFDYLTDCFKFGNSLTGRLKASTLTFAPPIILGILFPNGFIMAIGFAAIAATIFTGFIPAMMVMSARKMFPESKYRVPGGAARVYMVVIFATLVLISFTMNLMGLLPSFS